MTDATTESRKRRRAELGAFLRARRRAVQPADVDLPAVGRRHVRGLRREEVALLAGIGTSWYTLLEQGVVRNVSERTLLAIAHALRLNPRERDHLLALAGDGVVGPDAIAPATRHFVERIATGAAFLVNPRYDVDCWNAAADALFGFAARPATERNLLQALFLDAVVRSRFVSWDQTARDMVGTLRDNFARFGDASFAAFIDDLGARSPAFAALWEARPVRTVPTHETCVMRLPGREDVAEVHLTAFEPLDAPGYTLVALLTP